MIKSGIDQQVLIDMIATASARQGDAVRQGVRDLVLRALQGREMTIQNVRKVVRSVTDAASVGALKNAGPTPDVEALLQQTVAGIDDALLRAVEANRMALQKFVEQGVSLQEEHLKKALGDLEKFEDAFVKTVTKASADAGDRIQALWNPVLSQLKLGGTGTGASAAQAIEQFGGQIQSAMRESRAMGARAANAMLQSYAALVSGVLIGMSEGIQGGGPSRPAGAKTARK